MTGTQRNLWIDCLRGFSILMVVVSHGGLTLMPREVVVLVEPFAKGISGVQIFFTVSGFLIARNVLRRYGALDQVDIAQFYVMRIARILPLLLLFLSAMTLLFALRVPGFRSSPHLFAEAIYSALTFQYNWFYLTGGNAPGLYAMAPLWSLSIEEVFYFVFPVACFLTRRPAPLLVGFAITIALAPIVRASDSNAQIFFWGNADLLSLGCIAALIEARGLSRTLSPGMLCAAGAGILLAGVLLSPPAGRGLWQPTLIGVGSAAFLIGAGRLDGARPWRFAEPPVTLLATFGRASYELYLFHVAAIMLFDPYQLALSSVVGSDIVKMLISVGFLGTLLLAGLGVSTMYSEPLNRAIRRYYAETKNPTSRPLPVVKIA